MTKELTVALDISNPSLAKAFQQHSKVLPGVKVIQWPSSTGAGPSDGTVKNTPDIIILDDNEQNGNLFTRIKTTRQSFTQASIFIVSSNKDPQQIIDAMKAGAVEYLVEPIEEKTSIITMNYRLIKLRVFLG